jgi:hypothetical protein
MRIAKPMLLVLTPIGVGGGLYHAYRLGGATIFFLMLILVAALSAALVSVVRVIRRERSRSSQNTEQD